MIREGNIMQIDIPMSCPDCDGQMFSQSESKLGILKNKTEIWMACYDCEYHISVKEFKERLHTI